MTEQIQNRRAEFEARRRASTRQTSVRRVHSMLRATIRGRSIAPDEQIVESSVADSMAMSRNAVREALQRLAAEGLVARRVRFGTGLGPGSIMRLPSAEPWPVNRRDLAGDIAVRELECRQVPPSPYLRNRLELCERDEVVLVEHLIEVDGEPFCVRVSYRRRPPDMVVQPPRDAEMPLRAGPPMPIEAAYGYLRGRNLGMLESSTESVAGDPRTSRLLDLPDESPLLLRETFARDADGRPFEVSFTWYRGDRVAVINTAQAL
jgi:GntR family transcriptional regulator